MKIVDLARWQTPASAYPRGINGRARVRTHTYERGYYDCYGLRGFSHFHATRPLRITGLQIGRKTWMVDDAPHWWAMQGHAAAFHGHVVCAGLGLGLIVHALATNPLVTRITVVEIEQDVIDLIGPRVPPCKIIRADFSDWANETRETPDCILFDLFVGDGRELLWDAVRTRFVLQELFPDTTIRIHGFNNESLDRFGAAAQDGKAAWKEFWQREKGNGLLRSIVPK